MKISKNRFQGDGAGAIEGEAGTPETSAAKGTGFSGVDTEWKEAPLSLAVFSGAVSSRHTHSYYPVFVAPPPAPNVVKLEAEVNVDDIVAGLADKRIPNIGVSVNGNTITADGVTMTFERTAKGISIHAQGVGLQTSTVQAALQKAMSVGLCAKALSFLDKNPNTMVDVTVLPTADGGLQVRTKAKVKINPKLEKQGQFVLDQLDGGHTMPDRVRAAVAERARRGQVIG